MKILFFDSWLKGVANFNRLMPALQGAGAEVKMVHTGSWLQPQDAVVNQHDGFKSYDISYYGTWSLYEVLKRERPDVLVMLNLYWLTDMALVQFCRKLGIRVVYLSHGRFSAPAGSAAATRRKKKSLAERFNKENRMKLRNYALSTFVARRPWRFISTLWRNLTRPETMSLNSPYNSELRVDDIILYYETDRDIMVNSRHFPPDNITVGGNPELDQLAAIPTADGATFRKDRHLPDGPYLLYLDDGFVQNGFMSVEAWHRHLAAVCEAARQAGLSVVMKLHPRSVAAEHARFFASQGITALQNGVDMKNLILQSHTVTSLVSTTISFALILGKRVLSPRWGEVSRFNRSYPADVIHYCETPDEFSRWLSNGRETCSDHRYVRDNFGDLSGGAIDRIVSIITRQPDLSGNTAQPGNTAQSVSSVQPATHSAPAIQSSVNPKTT